MTKKLVNQAQYDQAVVALSALGLAPGTFCLMVLAQDLVDYANDPGGDAVGDEIGLDFVIESFAGDGMAYDLYSGELTDAWDMLEDV